MSRLSYDNQERIRADARVKVVELLKKHGINEKENKSTPTDDRIFIDNLTFSLFVMAISFENGVDIPEEWLPNATATDNHESDAVSKWFDLALLDTVKATTLVGNSAAKTMQAGDLKATTEAFGLSPFVVIPRLLLDNEQQFIDGYNELRDVFLLMISQVRSLSQE